MFEFWYLTLEKPFKGSLNKVAPVQRLFVTFLLVFWNVMFYGHNDTLTMFWQYH